MPKTILLTGPTDGLGARAAASMAQEGHHLILTGRRQEKLDEMAELLSPHTDVICYRCDLSVLSDVAKLADDIAKAHQSIDVIINNAGVLKAEETKTSEQLELRFVVNCIAPYLLTKRLLGLVPEGGRIVNLSSAAQTPLMASELAQYADYSDMGAYGRSKLAITAWTKQLSRKAGGRVFVSVNPGSLLGTKMVKEGFGIAGADIMIGADIIMKAAVSDEFNDANGLYYDNDAKAFGPPHEAAEDPELGRALITEMERILQNLNLG